ARLHMGGVGVRGREHRLLVHRRPRRIHDQRARQVQACLRDRPREPVAGPRTRGRGVRRVHRAPPVVPRVRPATSGPPAPGPRGRPSRNLWDRRLMAHATTYSALKSLLVTRLKARTGLAGVSVLYQAPKDPADVASLGSREAIWFLGAEGEFSSVVFCDGGLRFDESVDITLVAQVLGTDSLHDQENVDRRCEEVAYEILAELADPDFRDAITADTTLSAFDYVI